MLSVAIVGFVILFVLCAHAAIRESDHEYRKREGGPDFVAYTA